MLSGWIPADGESEFDAHQVDLLLALAEIESEMGPYGQPYSEAMSEGANLNRDGYAPTHMYKAVGPRVNYAVRAVEEAQEKFRKSLPEGAEMPKGLIFSVEKVAFAKPDASSDRR